jgi:UDP-N-acetylmuramoyl-L-alanyl-D-glutamate--2,6-diaminopimelate ligase
MLNTELDQNFLIDPARALLLLEVEGLLTVSPPEDSTLRRRQLNAVVPIIWDTRRLPETNSESVFFIARKSAKFDSHSVVPDLLGKGHFVLAERDHLLSHFGATPSQASDWLTEICQHPNLLLCSSTEKARNLLIRAVCCLQENKWTTLAITGTNGKTSTTQITGHLLEELSNGQVMRLGTLGIQVGDHLWENPFPTMPDFPGLMAALRSAKNQFSCSQLVMEATSIGIAENRLADWPVQCAAFLNLTQDHLDYHGTMETYLQAKLDLFRKHLLPEGHAVINCDDPHWEDALSAAQGKNRSCLVFGETISKEKFFHGRKHTFLHSRFLETSHKRTTRYGIAGQWTLWTDPVTPVTQCQYQVQLLGDVQHENLAAAAALMLSLGYPLEQICQKTGHIRSIPGRLESVAITPNENEVCVLVDYAHTPDALEKTLKTCRGLIPDGGQLVCVFGCGGDRDPGKRPKMGAIAARLADFVWVTSDNPRTEPPEKIIADVLTGVAGETECKIKVQSDRKTAIHEAISASGPRDIVLIAGKGHEDYQIVGTQKHPFSDSAVARQALKLKSNI